MGPQTRRPSFPLGRRYLVLRHGESEANVEGLIVSTLAGGAEAYGLTAAGRAQVRGTLEGALAEGALARGTRILASPFLRAVESAEVAAELLGTPIGVDERLRERSFGQLDRTPDRNYERVWALDRLDPGHTEWGVESVDAVAARVLEVLAEAEGDAKADGDDHGPVLLVTHGDAASILIAAVAGDLKRHRDIGGLPVGGLGVLGEGRP